MPFTFHAAEKLSPQAVNPYVNLISDALKHYHQTTNAAYLPQKNQADIFNKEISPLAALASNPNFTGFNPNVQKMIGQRIGNYLQGIQGGRGSEQPTDEQTTPAYATDDDIYKRLKEGSFNTLSPGSKRRLAQSNLASAAEQLGAPNWVSDMFGGSEASGQKGAFEQAKTEAERRLVLKGWSPHDAHRAVQELPNEPAEAYAKRTASLFIPSNKPKNENNATNNIDQKIGRDKQEKADAEATAKAFNTTPEIVLEALSMGVKTSKQFKEFLEWRSKNE